MIQIFNRLFPTKSPDVSQDDFDQAKVFLLLKYGTMRHAASAWYCMVGREAYTLAQIAVIKAHIRHRMGRTNSTDPR